MTFNTNDKLHSVHNVPHDRTYMYVHYRPTGVTTVGFETHRHSRS